MQPKRKIKTYKELIVWQKSYALAVLVHRLTAQFPVEERYGMVDQMRRASKGIPSDIAEGWGRATRKEFIRYLRVARGSLYELGTNLMMAIDLGYLSGSHEVHALYTEVERLLNGTIRSLQRKSLETS